MVAALMLWGDLAQALAAVPEPSFVVTRDEDVIRIEAEIDLSIGMGAAWSVLTDYEGYPRYISSMRESKVISHVASDRVVDQKGQFNFLFFSQGISVRKVVSEISPNVISSRVIDGDFRMLNERYELRQLGEVVHLSYSGRLIPKFELPPVLGLSVVRHVMLKNFREMLNEILRRDAESGASIRTKP